MEKSTLIVVSICLVLLMVAVVLSAITAHSLLYVKKESTKVIADIKQTSAAVKRTSESIKQLTENLGTAATEVQQSIQSAASLQKALPGLLPIVENVATALRRK